MIREEIVEKLKEDLFSQCHTGLIERHLDNRETLVKLCKVKYNVSCSDEDNVLNVLLQKGEEWAHLLNEGDLNFKDVANALLADEETEDLVKML